MIIREMTVKDAPKVYSLSSVELKDSSWSLSSILELAGDPRHYNLVATQNDEIVGFLLTSFYLDEGEILSVGVEEAYKRQGIATRLIDTACKHLLKEGVNRMLLEVHHKNAPAINLYTKLGFKQISWRQSYYNGQPALILEKML